MISKKDCLSNYGDIILLNIPVIQTNLKKIRISTYIAQS